MKMKDPTYNEIVSGLADFSPKITIFSDKIGRVSVGVEKLTGETGDPEVFFLVEKYGTPKKDQGPAQQRAHSLREALWMLGIEPEGDDAVGLNSEEDGA
jgi:hypothetical protein